MLDFGLVRDLDAGYVEGEREIMRALADDDAERVHAGLSKLGYLPEPQSVDGDALLEHLGDRRRMDAANRASGASIPPTSGRPSSSAIRRARPTSTQMRNLSMPPPTLLLRRMEVQLLALLGDLGAGGDWGAIAAEHHSGAPASTALGRELS